jgi:hypothetical protein
MTDVMNSKRNKKAYTKYPAVKKCTTFVKNTKEDINEASIAIRFVYFLIE